MQINGGTKEIALSWYELINKLRFNAPKRIKLLVPQIPEEQRYCTWDEKELVYKQDYNNSVVHIPLGLEIYVESVAVTFDDCDPLETLFGR